jgi:hypothetical protein
LHVHNDPINYVDFYGLQSQKKQPKPVEKMTPEELDLHCQTLWNLIWDAVGKIEQELAKYDPQKDQKGGHPHKYGTTVKYGHKTKIGNLQNQLRNRIKQFEKDCWNWPKGRKVHEDIKRMTEADVNRLWQGWKQRQKMIQDYARQLGQKADSTERWRIRAGCHSGMNIDWKFYYPD